MSGPVVVGVDGTADAVRAVRWAAAHAGLHGAGLRLVHAGAPHDSAVRQARDLVGGLPVTVVTGEDHAARLLVRESADASLVVLGSRGHGGYHGLLIGTTTATVVTRGRCPVVVVGGAGHAGDGPVVVGDDGTWTSDAALDFALREASLRGTGLIAVHGLVVPPGSDVALARDRADEALAERLARHGAHHPDVKVGREVVADTPGRALLSQAASAQLVVVGSGRRAGHRGALLRSTGQYLLHQAPCPVAVVRRDHPI